MHKLHNVTRTVIKSFLWVLAGGALFLWFKGLYIYLDGDWRGIAGITVLASIGMLYLIPTLIIAFTPPPTSIPIANMCRVHPEYDLGWKKCPNCNRLIGHQLARAIKADFAERVRKTQEMLPMCDIHFTDIWSFNCPYCNSQVEFNYVRHTITLKDNE